MEKLKSQNLENILDEGVRKSVRYFNKKIRKMLTGTTQAQGIFTGTEELSVGTQWTPLDV